MKIFIYVKRHFFTTFDWFSSTGLFKEKYLKILMLKQHTVDVPASVAAAINVVITFWRVSAFRAFLVHIFLNFQWICRDTPYVFLSSPNARKYGPEKLRIWTLFMHFILFIYLFIYLFTYLFIYLFNTLFIVD